MTVMELKRREAGLTLKELGEHRQVRIAHYFLSLCEQHRGIPNEDQAKRIATALGVRPEDLLKDVVLDADAIARLEPIDAAK
jgi:transcriptional regulator with XRE-family HTH domain